MSFQIAGVTPYYSTMLEMQRSPSYEIQCFQINNKKLKGHKFPKGEV